MGQRTALAADAKRGLSVAMESATGIKHGTGSGKRSGKPLQEKGAADMNKVILMGRLTSDPKMDWTRSEDSKQYATYTLAVNRRFKKNGQADTDFISCIAWGAMAEFAEKFMKKGAMFAVEGRLNVRSWEKDGERHWTTTVVVENCYFTGSKRDAENKPVAEQSRPATAQSKPAAQEGFYPIDESVEDDDLPF